MNSILVSLWLLGGSCAGPDAESARLIDAVTSWIAAGDSLFRADSGADIVLETDEAVCSRLIEAYSKLPGEVDTPGSLYVVRIGRTHYGTFDPNDMAGTSRTVMIFDSQLRLQASQANTRGHRRQVTRRQATDLFQAAGDRRQSQATVLWPIRPFRLQVTRAEGLEPELRQKPVTCCRRLPPVACRLKEVCCLSPGYLSPVASGVGLRPEASPNGFFVSA